MCKSASCNATFAMKLVLHYFLLGMDTNPVNIQPPPRCRILLNVVFSAAFRTHFSYLNQSCFVLAVLRIDPVTGA